jgi:hypothetical protein
MVYKKSFRLGWARLGLIIVENLVLRVLEEN